MKNNRREYEMPWIAVIRFTTEDVLAPSNVGGGDNGPSNSGSDNNQGEWDPQSSYDLKTSVFR